MEEQLADTRTAQDLPEQFSIVGHGAQYIVAMLSGPCQEEYTEFWLGEEPAPRVIKIPLPREHVVLAVENMNVDAEERYKKVAELIALRQKHMMETLVTTYFDRPLWHMLGRPRAVLVPDAAFTPSQRSPVVIIEPGKQYVTDQFIPCYSQDYSPSLTPLIPSEAGTKAGELLRTLLDQYALLQQQLIGRCLLDDIFKLDNYGFTSAGITTQDFSEYQDCRDAADAAIRAKKWEQITENSEYTQLTPNMQDYFNARMAEALPPRIIDTWGNSAVERSRENIVGMLEDLVRGSCVERIMGAFNAET